MEGSSSGDETQGVNPPRRIAFSPEATERSSTERTSEELVAIVFSHTDVPRAILDSVTLDVAARQRLHTLARARDASLQGVLSYSTCLRTEIYAVSDDATRGVSTLTELLQDVTGAPAVAIEQASPFSGADAARHLLRVAAGLESVLIGEDEIHGQIRKALRSVDSAVAGPVIHRLFESASTTGARVRHETALGGGRPALGRTAASHIGAPIAGDENCLALIIGAGVMARQAARQLQSLGWQHIAIANRTLANAETLAREVGGTAHSLQELDLLIARSAVVVTALSDSPSHIDAERVRRACTSGMVPRAMVDLASPRNIASDVRDIASITLTGLDGFVKAARERRDAYALAIPAAEAIVNDELRRFLAWSNHRRLVPFVRRLKETVQHAADCELDALLVGRPSAERDALRRVSQAMVNRLLHHPLTRLRHIAGEHPDQVGALAQLEALFAPNDDSTAPLFAQHIDA